jgi:hypothetical protein
MISPLDLKFYLLHLSFSLVLNVENRIRRNSNPLTGNLYAKTLSTLESIGKASQLCHKLGG